jgi:tripartite-type tricarboxylate transporter receptor subunit TctC
VTEAGVPGFEANNYFGFFAPKGTPQAMVDTLSAALKKALADPELGKLLAAQGAELRYTPPAETAALVRKEHELWGGVVKSANIPVQ